MNHQQKHAKWVADMKKALAHLKAKCADGHPITQEDIDGIVVIFSGGGPVGDEGEGP